MSCYDTYKSARAPGHLRCWHVSIAEDSASSATFQLFAEHSMQLVPAAVLVLVRSVAAAVYALALAH
eukprot:19839-Heterococcus_DN1.PRE.4